MRTVHPFIAPLALLLASASCASSPTPARVDAAPEAVDAKALVNEAAALRAKGDLNAAEAALNKALEANPRLAAGWFNLGNVLVASGRFEEAVRQFDESVRIEPSFADAWVNRGHALRRLRRGDEATESFARATREVPGDVRAWNGLGAALAEAGDLPASLKAFEKARALDPQDAAAAFNVGLTLAELKRADEAVAHLRRFLELAPKSPKAGKVRRRLAELAK